MGRFLSEDPIQDGVNWYMFAGNDPVNFADPSGLAMQGYPLAGGYSGNVTTAPTISSGNIAANSLGGGPALSPATNSFLQGAVNQSLNPVSSITPLYSQRFLNELGPIVAANQQTQMNANFAAARIGLTQAVGGWGDTVQYTIGAVNRALAAAGDHYRTVGNALASGIEYVTSGYDGTLGNVVAGAGGGVAHLVRTVGNVNASVVDVPRTLQATMEDVRQTVRTGQQYGVRTAAARQLGLLAGAEAYYGTDVMTYQEVDAWSKTSEAFGRFGGAAGTAAGVGSVLSPKLTVAPSRPYYEPPASTPVGRSGQPLGGFDPIRPTNAPATISGRSFSGHAVDRMQSQGLVPSAVENTIQYGKSVPGKVTGTTAHFDPKNNITVITDTPTGRVITVDRGQIKQ